MRQWTHFKTDLVLRRTPTALLPLFLLTFVLPLFAQTSLNVSPENRTAAAVSLYKLEFALPEALPADGALTVTFPEGFDLSRVKIAASATINGGFETHVKGRRVVIVRKGEGKSLNQGASVDLLLTAVKNAEQALDGYRLTLSAHQSGSETLRRLTAETETETAISETQTIQGTFRLEAAQ